jgi:hypothetical protein
METQEIKTITYIKRNRLMLTPYIEDYLLTTRENKPTRQDYFHKKYRMLLLNVLFRYSKVEKSFIFQYVGTNAWRYTNIEEELNLSPIESLNLNKLKAKFKRVCA